VRTLRRILLVSALLLLGLASAAPAECAWVLWQQQAPHAQWTPVDSFASRPIDRWGYPVGPPPRLSAEDACKKARDASLASTQGTTAFTCLPDTVDPRK
jgi:hypothetical protein